MLWATQPNLVSLLPVDDSVQCDVSVRYDESVQFDTIQLNPTSAQRLKCRLLCVSSAWTTLRY